MATKCLTTTWKHKASNFAKVNNINENNAIEQLIGIINRPEGENMSDDEIMTTLSDIFNAKVDRTEFTENQNKIFDTLVNREYVNLNVIQKSLNTLQKCTTSIQPFVYKTQEGTYKIGVIDRNNVSDKTSDRELAQNKRQQEVEELFNNNPELANSVYEALGYKTNSNQKQEEINKYWERVLKGLPESEKQKEIERVTTQLIEKKNAAVKLINNRENIKWLDSQEALEVYDILGDYLFYNIRDKKYDDIEILDRLTPEIDKINAKYNKNNIQITTQQKQQAQQLYSSYLQTTNNPTIKGFKQWNNRQQQVNELFDSNETLANAVYEATSIKTNITQDDKSYYRGQISKPKIDKDGNLLLFGVKDELYKKAGLPYEGISMTDDLQSAIDYGIGQLETAKNLASETYDYEADLERLDETGYFIIQIPKNISNEIVKEAGEVKVIGNKIIIPKGQYKIEQIIDGVDTEETPLQKTTKEIENLIERMEETYIRHKDFNNEESPYNHIYGIPTTEQVAKAYQRDVEVSKGKVVITGWEEKGKWYKPNDISVSQIYREKTGEKFGKDNPWGLPSSYIGNTVDMFNRDFFELYEKNGHALEPTVLEMSKKKYPNMNQQMLDSLLSSMENAINDIKNEFGINDENYKLITKEFPLGGKTILNDKELTVVGTTDMILIDKEGNVHVIDFKTIRNTGKWQNKLSGYTNQVNSYNSLIAQNTNLSDKIGKSMLLSYYTTYPAPAQTQDGNISSFGVSYVSMKTVPNQLYVVVANQYVPLQDLDNYKNYPLMQEVDTRSTMAYNLVQNITVDKPLTSFFKDDFEELTEEEKIEIQDEVTGHPVEIKVKPSIEDEHLANLMYTKLMSASEQQFHADNIMKMLSYMVSNLQTNSEIKKVYFPNNEFEEDFTAMSRFEIIQTIGLGKFLSTIKEYYYNPENENGFLATCDDTDILDKAQLVYDNFDAFVTKGSAKLANLEKVSISKNVIDIVEDNGDLDSSNETESESTEHTDREHYMVGFRQLSAKSSILNDVKRTVEKLKVWNVEIDSEGNIIARYPQKDKYWGMFDETIDSDKAVEHILSWCNKCTTVEEMLDILKNLAPQHTWLYSIIGLKTGNQNVDIEGLVEKEPFRSQFFHSFRRDFATYSAMLLDKDDDGNYVWKTKIINTQAAADALMQHTVSNFKLGDTKIIFVENKDIEGKGKVNVSFIESIEERRKELANLIASENFKTKETQDKISEGILQLMKDLGIPALNLSEGLNPIKDLIAIDLSAPQNTNGYQCADILKNISYITRTLLNNQKRTNYNPMLMGEKESTYSNYKNILQITGPYIEDSVEASVYENGKMYYSFTPPSFLQKEINKLNNSLGKDEQGYDKYLQDTYGKYNWFKGTAGWRTPWLQIMQDDPDARTNLAHKVQICSDKTDFKDLSPFGYSISILQEYFAEKNYAWYRVPLLSNKPSAEFIHFKKFTQGKSYDYKEVIAKYLRSVALQEMIRIKSVIENIPSQNASKIKNFDVDKKVLSKHPKLIEKVKNKKENSNELQEHLTRDEMKLLIDSGANFKFLPVFNDFLFGNKSDESSHLLMDYINGKKLSSQELTELQTWLIKQLPSYMEEKANKMWETITKQGLLNYTATEKTVEKTKREYRNYSFLSNMVSKSFNERKNEKLKNDTKKKLTDAELNKEIENEMYDEVKANFEEFVWNDKLASINIIELTTTDLAFYKNSDDFQKRYAEVHSPTLKLNLTTTFTLLDDNGNPQETRYSADGIERSIVLRDYEVRTNLENDLKTAFDKILETSKLPENQLNELKRTFNTVLGLYAEGINMTDAQAYSSPTSYRKKMGMAGKFTQEMEEAYQEICKGNFNINDIGVLMQPLKPFVYGQTTKPSLGKAMPLRKVPQQHKNSEYLLFLADAILRGSKADSKLIALFDFMEDSAYKGRERVRNGKVYKDGVPVRKANSTESEGSIIKRGVYTGKGIDTVQFESAIKAGLQGIIDINDITDYDDILTELRNKVYATEMDENGNISDNPIYSADKSYNYSDPYDITYVNHISFEDYGIQQEVPNHFKDHEQLIGSQQRIITISDIADDAFFAVKNSDGTTDKMSKKEIIDEYQHLHTENIKQSFETLKLDLLLDTNLREQYIKKLVRKALTENTDKTPAQNLEAYLKEMENTSRLTDCVYDQKMKNTLLTNIKKVEKHLITSKTSNLVEEICKGVDFTITDAARNQTMSNLLKNEIKKDQRYGSDLLYACSINPVTGTFNIPLSDPIQSLRIQQLLHSIIKSRINKQVTSGGPVVQTSCFGLSDNLHIVWENGHIKHYECYMPIPSEEIRQAITRADGTIMSPQEAVKAGILNEEQLYAIGYRIPTEDKYSMIPLYIKDWVPAAAGEAIIMPAEITKQTGSDFDIDKMYIMVKSFKKVNKSGVNVKAFKNKIVQEAKKHYKNNSDALRQFIYGNINKGGTEEGVDYYINLITEHPGIKFTRIDENGVEHKDTKGLLIQSKLSDDLYYKNSFEQYSNIETREGRNNRIFDIQWGILTNIDSVEKIMNPGNFDRLKKINNIVTVLKDKNNTLSYKELSEKAKDEVEDLAKQVNANIGRNITDIESHLYYFQQNMSAAKLIGAFANNNVSHGFISLLEDEKAITMMLDDEKAFTFDGVEIRNNKFDSILALNGVDRISKNIANFLAAAVDAVKDNALAGLNMNTATVNPAMVLARLGFDLESIGLFFSNPIIVQTVEKYFVKQDISFTNLNDVIDEELQNTLNFSPDDIKTMDKNLVGNAKFTKEEMAKNTVSPDLKMNAYMLLLLKRLNMIADQMDSITYLTKFNSVTNAAGPSLANTIIMKQKVAKLAKNHLKNPIFNNNILHILDNSELLKAFHDTTIGENGAVDLVFKPYFIQMTDVFNAMVDELDIRTQGNLTEKMINQLANDFTMFQLTKRNVFDGSYKARHYMAKEFPSKFIGLIEKTDSPMKQFIHKTTTGKVPVATLTSYVNGLSADGQTIVKQEWVDLHNNYGEDFETVSTELALYNIMRGGFGYSPKTMTHLIPSFIKQQIQGYIESFNDIEDFANCSSCEIANMMDQFFRNHTNERKICPTIDVTKCKGTVDENGNLAFVFTKDNKDVKSALQVSGNDQNPVYYYIIRYNNKLYKLENGLQQDSPNKVTYIETTKLGISNDFLEYDYNQLSNDMKSVFEKSDAESNEGSDNNEDKENQQPVTSKDIDKQYSDILSKHSSLLQSLLSPQQQEFLKIKEPNKEAFNKIKDMLRREIDLSLPGDIIQEINTIINELHNLC